MANEAVSFKDRLPTLDYGDLALPQLSEMEAGIRGMALEYQDLEAFISEQGEGQDLEALYGLQGSFALRRIDVIVGDFASARLASHLHLVAEQTSTEALGGDEAELSRKQVAYKHGSTGVRLREWTNVPADSAEKFVLIELVARSNRLKYQLIHHWLENAVDTGLTPVAELEYTHLMPAMAATDNQYLKVSMEEPAINSDERKTRGMLNERAIVRSVAGEVKEIPFSQAYPEETDAMVAAYQNALDGLAALRVGLDAESDRELIDLIERKRPFFEAIRDAYQNDGVDPKNKTWYRVDELLAGQADRIEDGLVFHPMETNYMKDKILRAPEMCIRILDREELEAQRIASATKERMIRSLKSDAFDAYPKAQEAIRRSLLLMETSKVAVRHWLSAGRRMNMRPVGNMVPNGFAERTKGGAISSFDAEGVRSREQLTKDAYDEVFGPGSFERVAHRFPTDEGIGRDIAEHELGHTIGAIEDTEERIGKSLVHTHCEEWKATAVGALANNWIPHLDGEINHETLVTSIISRLLRACRYAGLRDNPFAAAYFRKSMMFMKIMEEEGLLIHDEATNPEFPWQPNFKAFDEATIRRFFERLTMQLVEFLEIYLEKQPADMVAFLHRELQPCEFVRFLCERRKCPNAEKHMPDAIAAVPSVSTASATEIAAEVESAVEAAVTAED